MGGEVDREVCVCLSVCVSQYVCVWRGCGVSAKAVHSHNRNYLHNGRLR